MYRYVKILPASGRRGSCHSVGVSIDHSKKGGSTSCDLNWDEERYKLIKDQLVEEGAVIVGRGKGGTVGLTDAPGAKGLTVFVSYSHTDEGMKNELLKHLEPLRRRHRIDTWHDGKIKPGDEWEKSISGSLEKADVILLLVSIDFINSTYCYDVELENAMERHSRKEAVVVPVILRSCLWQHAPFSKLQALPKNGKAVSGWEDQDEAFMNVAEGIWQLTETILAER